MRSETALKHLGIDPKTVRSTKRTWENSKMTIEIIHFDKNRERLKTIATLQNSKVIYRSTR